MICTRLLQDSCSMLLYRYTAHISSNGSHFLTAGFLMTWTYKVSKIRYCWTKLEVTMFSKYTAHKGHINQGVHLIGCRMHSNEVGNRGSSYFSNFLLFYCLLSRDSPKTVQRQSRDSPETVQGQSRDCPETVQRQSRDSPETVQRQFRDSPETVQRQSWDFSDTV